MSIKDDKAEAFRAWEAKTHRRMLRNLWRIADAEAARIAARATRQRRRRWQPPQTPEPFNPVAEIRREIMPIVAQMAGLAGGDPKPLLELAKPRRRTSRRKGTSERGG